MIDETLDRAKSPEVARPPQASEPEANFVNMCNELEVQIRSHARLISGYGYSTNEGMEDLRLGLLDLLAMVQDSASGVDDGSPTADVTAQRCQNLLALSRSIEQDVNACTIASERLCNRLIRQLRESDVGNRRLAARTPINLACTLALGSARIACRTCDISIGGARLHFLDGNMHAVSVNQSVTIEIEGAGRVQADIVALAGTVCHVAFKRVDPGVRDRIEAMAQTLRGYLEATAARIPDLVDACQQTPGADWLFEKLDRETQGLRALRVADMTSGTLSDFSTVLVADGDLWPAALPSETSMSAIHSVVCEGIVNPMLMTVCCEHPELAAVQFVLDTSFVNRQCSRQSDDMAMRFH